MSTAFPSLPRRRTLATVAPLFLLVACGGGSDSVDQGANGAGAAGSYTAFSDPRRVTIRGYDGDAMEPFIARDGRYLFFNNPNDPEHGTDLHFAERVDDLTFDYRGEVEGVNTPVLECVPSLDLAGNLFFVSTRSYRSTLSSLYRGHFSDGAVSAVELVPGVSRNERGFVTFDAEIAADGKTLFVVDGQFTGEPVPGTADIVVAVREGREFRRDPERSAWLANVNTPDALEYAPAVSADLLELFFTRLAKGRDLWPTIWRSSRTSVDEPFGAPQRLAALTNLAEAPSLSGDGHLLYYHERVDGHFYIARLAR